MDLTHLSSNLKIKTNFNLRESFGLSNINSITGIVDNSVTSLQALIFPNDNPEYDDIDPTNFDITGITSGNKCFIFDIKKEYKLNLGSEITDHYVEDNVAMQDHIGLKPVILEVTGCIGEVDLAATTERWKKLDPKGSGQNNEKGNIFNSVDSYLGRMGSLTSFAPNLANQAYDVYNTAKYTFSMATKVMNLDKQSKSANKTRYAYSEVYDENVIEATKQFTWIDWFKQRWWNRASFSIVTPYGVLKNMYIMELSASQPENTRYVTNLNIKFKQIRKAVVATSEKSFSQTMDTQASKQEEEKTNDKDTISLQNNGNSDATPPTKEGLVTQVNEEEYERYANEVASMAVEELKKRTTFSQAATNNKLFQETGQPNNLLPGMLNNGAKI